MKNILKIIASDIKRLTKNVVAVVVIIGLTVIPCLYAWFNILSNWDPYGPDATSNLQVAVVSVDQGLLVGNKEINVGEKIVDNLKENKTIGWVFCETAEEAINGVHSGDYYAALVIDQKFSADLVSFLSGSLENPNIIYYENEKKNAIAPKITGKVKTTIQNSVNQAFISTLTSTFLATSEYLIKTDEEGNITGAAIDKLKNLDNDMKAVILLLDSYIALMDSTENLMASGQAVSDSVDSMLSTAETMAQSAEGAVDTAKIAGEAMSKTIDTSCNTMNSTLDILATRVNSLKNDAVNNSTKVATGIAAIKEVMPTEETAKNIYEKAYENESDEVKAILDAQKESLQQKQADVDAQYAVLKSDLDKLDAKSKATNEDIKKIAEDVLKDIDNCKASVESLRAEYKNTVAPQFSATFTSVDKSVNEIERILNYNASSIDVVAASLGDYPDMMSQSKETLQKSKEEAEAMEAKLAKMIEDIEGMDANEQYQKFLELAKNDPSFLGEFISSPVKVQEQYIYPVENNGSMTAPFYIVLSIWVGALIMSTILKTEIKNKSEFENLTTCQAFFGRFFITFLIGQTQTLITVLGALFFVGIQCKHMFLFWLACSWTSFVYSLYLYSLTFSFGNIGEALSVVLMVIQVAGAGGTFPIEVLPKVFQVLYKFMPFNYSMNAVRECIGGFYKYNYWIYLAILLAYVALACINGLLLYKPSMILNKQIEKSKEKSGILI